MSVLYQKYRPQKFSDVFGQQHIKVTIQNQIANNKTAHAYLFCGPRAVGKTTIARLLAKAVNCDKRQEGSAEPCDECSSCVEIREGRALDIIEIDAASHTGVDNVRENIIANSRITPSRGKFKVFIIDEVHMLSVSAFNALLKTLEEPPRNVIFILATTEIHKVPGTIISRCQRYDFKKISANEIMENLAYIVSEEGREVDQEVLKNIAVQSEGCLRDAQSLLGQVLFLDDKRITLEMAEIVIPRADFSGLAEFAEYLFEGNIEKAIYYINKAVQEGLDAKIFVKNFIEFLRKIILVKIGGGLEYFSIDFDEEVEKRILNIAEAASAEKITRAIELFIAAGDNFKKSDIATLPIEIAVLKFVENCGSARGYNTQSRAQNFANDDNEAVSEKDSFSRSPLDRPSKTRHSEPPPFAKGGGEESRGARNGLSNAHFAAGSFAPQSGTQDDAMVFRQPPMDGDQLLAEKDICRDEALFEGLSLRAEDQVSNSENTCLTIEDIQNKWADVVEGIKKYNHSMCFILKVSKPIEISGNTLKLAHSHLFHQERAQDMKNRKGLEEILKEIFGYDLLVESIVDASLCKDMDVSENAEFSGEINAEIENPSSAGADAGRKLEIEEKKEAAQDNNLLDDILSEMGGEVVGESL